MKLFGTVKYSWAYLFFWRHCRVFRLNHLDVIVLKVDATHYYRYFREGTTDAEDPGVIREQTRTDGINWSPATTLFADNSGGCGDLTRTIYQIQKSVRGVSADG